VEYGECARQFLGGVRLSVTAVDGEGWTCDGSTGFLGSGGAPVTHGGANRLLQH
jgi:hypothetical protein